MMLQLQEQGCHNINLVTPEHVVPQILEALLLAVELGLRLPLAYNTSAYDSLDSLRLMNGIVGIYMPDFKFWDAESAHRYAKSPGLSGNGTLCDQGDAPAGWAAGHR
jgi:putative pyruvate formate lyase activating enzyme